MFRSALSRSAAQLAGALALTGALMASQAISTPVALAASHGHAPLVWRVSGEHAMAPGPVGRVASAPAPCPNANLTPTSANIPQIEAATMCLINQQRVLRHEHPLRENADLTSAAVGHAQDMVTNDYYSHTSLAGATLLDRVQATGYLPHADSYILGENIDFGTLWLATPASIVSGWMSSPEHKANILDSDFVDTGIGVVASAPVQFAGDQSGATYTQDFGVVQTPRGAIS
jgi:uncharacterized protein YkwD